MRKILKCTLAILLAVVITVGAVPLASFVEIELPNIADIFVVKVQAATSGYYTYSVSYNEARIGDVDPSISGDITIPSTLGGYPVIEIGRYAFSDCDNLTSVTIPDSVTSIGQNAFQNCDALTRVTIGKGVTSIGAEAFGYCDSLTSIAVNYSNITYSCDEDGVLFNKDKTELIQYPRGKARTNYIIPDSVTSIGDNAFLQCDSLTSITIPHRVTSIGVDAFMDCDSLTSVTIPDSVTSIGSSVFYDCDGLTSITIPDSVTSIGSSVFYDCDGLTSITIPDSINYIGWSAFGYCSSLVSITIPDSVTTIRRHAFESCGELKDVYYKGSEAAWNKILVEPDNDPLLNANIHFNCVSNENDTPNRVTGIDIPETKIQMTDSAMLIEATVYPETAENEEIIWSSSNPNIAIFQNDSIGVLTAIGDGYTVVTATTVDGGYSDSCIVFVGNETMVVSSNDGNSIAEDETHEFMVTLIDLDSLEQTDSGQICFTKPSSETNGNINFVVENNSVAKISSIENTDNIIKLKIKGISSGTTYVTMTNSKTHEEKYLPIYVYDGENTFYADSVPKYIDFYGEAKNFNHNELKIYDYEYMENGNGTTDVNFNIYSSNTNCGSVEVYDADGNLKNSYMIEPFHGGDPTGFWDNLELMGQTVEVLVNLELNNSTNPVCSTKTSISTTIPKDGYLKITNDISDSDICLLYNIVTLAIKSIDFQKSEIDLAGDVPKVAEEASKKLINEILGASGKTIKGILNKIIKKLDIPNATLNTKDVLELIQTLFDNLNIDFGEIFLESIEKVCVEKLADILIERLGVYGKTVKGLFAFNEGLQIYNLGEDCHSSILSGSAYIYGKQSDTGKKVSNGIIYEGSVDTETVFRTYAIAYGDIYVEMSTLYGAEDIEFYDISLVKDGDTVQPSEKSSVYIKIPEDWQGDKIKVYRVTMDGAQIEYEDMNAHRQDGYMVFETDHFSYYALINEFEMISSIRNPSNTNISYGDSIILHNDLSETLPSGWSIKWTASNENFDMDVSVDGNMCIISPKKSGNTTFTATVYDAKGNSVSSDEQVMTSKAGFFDKIIAFFKKLFGLTKTIPQIYNGIF